MLRFALAVMLIGLLLTASTVLQLLTTSYLFGLASGLLLGMVLWLKVRRRKPTP
jgi:NhaP-type Na+/H+ or K+/H+ antiporter